MQTVGDSSGIGMRYMYNTTITTKKYINKKVKHRATKPQHKQQQKQWIIWNKHTLD